MNFLAIFQQELRGYFTSSVAYIVAGVFWLIAGAYIVGMLFGEQGLIQQVAFSDRSGLIVQPIDVAYIFLNSFFAVLGSLCLFLLPFLVISLDPKANKRATLEFIAASPINNWLIAVGKLLGVISFFLFIIAPLLLWEVIIFSAAEPAIPAAVPLLAHCGLILFAAAILSIGMCISCLTDKKVVAVILTFAVVFFIWLIDLIAQNIEGVVGNYLKHLSLIESYNKLIQGILELSDVVLLLSYIFLGIFLTVQSITVLHLARQSN